MSQISLELQPFADGFSIPVDIAHANDDRLFVVGKRGTVEIIDTTGERLGRFLDIGGRVNSGASERGLLGLAFHPDYDENGFFFVNYTRQDGRTVVSRFNRDESNPSIADPESEKVILVVDQPFSNHNAGDLEFGPDGYLYIGTGDGGSGNDPGNRSQNRQQLLGKMLRIDIDSGDPYAIPPDNPFVETDETLDEIWAIGLRNPWRYSFDRLTGDLYISDVGQDQYEEVNLQLSSSTGGENYGWRCYEGPDAHITGGCADASAFTGPAFAYGHDGFNCSGSITGGYIYRGASYPNMYGLYLCVDYCTGVFRSFDPSDSTTEVVLVGDAGVFTSFGEDASGELYLASATGEIFKIVELTSSIEEVERKALRIYPSPARNRIFLDIPGNVSAAAVTVFDGSGRKVISDRGYNGTGIEVSDLPPGVYTLTVKFEEGEAALTGRFVLAR